jgi:hypothetical protein
MRRLTLVAWAGLAGGVAAGCTEDLVAPGAGACPDFCPPEQVAVVDTTLMDVVLRDSAYSGYVLPHEASGLQLVADPGGTIPSSRAVIRVFAFSERLLLTPGDTTTGPVLGTDSFTVQVNVQARGALGLELAFYRLPATVDSAVSFTALDPFFTDSTRLATVPIPDSLVAGTVAARLAGDAFPTLDADGRVAALGVEVRTADRGFVTLGSIEGADATSLTRHVQVDSAGVSVARQDARQPALDTFVAPDLPAPPADVLRVGGAPSSRSLLRFSLPAGVLDSSTVVRATLLLVPTQPVLGAPGDTLRLLAQALAVDVGAKSPLVNIQQDSLLARLVRVIVGAADTVRIDVTTLVLSWAADSTRPRGIMVRAVPEGNSFVEAQFGSSANPASRPALQVTFVPPITLGGR